MRGSMWKFIIPGCFLYRLMINYNPCRVSDQHDLCVGLRSAEQQWARALIFRPMHGSTGRVIIIFHWPQFELEETERAESHPVINHSKTLNLTHFYASCLFIRDHVNKRFHHFYVKTQTACSEHFEMKKNAFVMFFFVFFFFFVLSWIIWCTRRFPLNSVKCCTSPSRAFNGHNDVTDGVVLPLFLSESGIFLWIF